jgi:predicted metal-binding protein
MISETVEHFNGIAWTIVTGYEDVSIKNYEEYGCPLGESATCDRCDYCKLDKCTHPVAARVENNK